VAALAAPYVHPRLAASVVKDDRPTAINIVVETIDGKPDALQPTEVVPVDIDAIGGNGQQADSPPSTATRWLS
jgi:hypothetical protein